MNEGTTNDASMNEERIRRINEAEELFDKLYDFFHRYVSPSGSVYFQHTPAHKNICEKVYADDRDVVLFWKAHQLYYVKTERPFTCAL